MGGMSRPSRALGDNQTWQDVTASRAKDTVYTNTTGRAIIVSLITAMSQNPGFTLQIDGVSRHNASTNMPSGSTSAPPHWFIVPPGSTYKLVSFSANSAFTGWHELR